MAPPTVAPAPAPSPAPAPPNPTDILRAAGDMGFGAKAAKDIAAGLSAGAQLIRQKGKEYHDELMKHAGTLDELCNRTNSMRNESWKSESGQKYREQLENRRKDAEHSRDELRTAAQEALQAGEEIAQNLEAQSALINNAANQVDSILHSLAHGAADAADKIGDIIKKSGIGSAQDTLNALADNGSKMLQGLGSLMPH
ncbi:hypothetical protein D8M41_08345 [Rothia sp. HSID18069]|uniref:Uncharacterized protein n=2 Tax=Rothia aeria TaxID=172042 RepID=I0UWD8_9MICC|nr:MULTISPECIES: glycoside hydrolase family 9 protein [Rothia]EID52191.1 hypothetical protein HMPREF1324_1773 [Rothia aeria F0474]QXW92159.1 glycoside hydrolase family 9 protein [Rothia aeria]RUP71328.1 hypothetical protein D8M41_08345 [Rothia sp. HSID18069]TEA44396.1 hypothetical protein C0Z14_00615 [Rothia aeria]